MASLGPPGTQGPVGIAPTASNGWGQVRWAVNRDLPQALIRTEALLRHAARITRHTMRVS